MEENKNKLETLNNEIEESLEKVENELLNIGSCETVTIPIETARMIRDILDGNLKSITETCVGKHYSDEEKLDRDFFIDSLNSCISVLDEVLN